MRVMRVMRAAGSSSPLRRVLVAFAAFEIVDLTIWIVLLVYGYKHGGTTGSVVMALVQLVPAAALAPWLGALADRTSPERVLLGGYGFLALTTGAMAAAIAAHAAAPVVFALAPLSMLSLTGPRPALASILPALVTTPEQLTAANVMEGWAEVTGNIAGPAVAALLVSTRGPALAMTVSSAVMLAAALWTFAGLPRASLVRAEPALSGAALPDQDPASKKAGARRNFTLVRQSPATLLLLGLHGFYYLVIGAMEIVCVVLAAAVLHLGVADTGYLTACLGAGTVVAGAVSVVLVGRAQLAGVIARSLALVMLAFVVLAVAPRLGDTFVILAAIGFGGALTDVSTRVLLLRVVPSNAIAGAFSFFEAVMNVGLAVGALLARGLIACAGAQGALYGLAALAALALAAVWRPLRSVDADATVPQVEVRLLRAIPIFSALPAPALEGVGRQLLRQEFSAGTAVVSEGERGDRWYVVAEGSLRVTRDGALVATLGRGDGFGEIALVRGVPRSATVTADTNALLYSLDGTAFQLVLTRYAPAGVAAERLADQRLATGRDERQ
jgi:predicted MFS family arabinose efflux permease